jgi:hypothetical protein
MPDITTYTKEGKPVRRWSIDEEIIPSEDHPDFSYSLWVNTFPVIYYRGQRLTRAHEIPSKRTMPWPGPHNCKLTKHQAKLRFIEKRKAELMIDWILNGPPEMHTLMVLNDRFRLRRILEKEPNPNITIKDRVEK